MGDDSKGKRVKRLKSKNIKYETTAAEFIIYHFSFII